MNNILLRALLALVPAATLFSWSAMLFFRRKNAWSLVQAIGAGCLVVVVVAHICEALRIFPWMHWGEERSAGHYLDLASAVLGLILFPIGLLARTLRGQTVSQRRVS